MDRSIQRRSAVGVLCGWPTTAHRSGDTSTRGAAARGGRRPRGEDERAVDELYLHGHGPLPALLEVAADDRAAQPARRRGCTRPRRRPRLGGGGAPRRPGPPSARALVGRLPHLAVRVEGARATRHASSAARIPGSSSSMPMKTSSVARSPHSASHRLDPAAQRAGRARRDRARPRARRTATRPRPRTRSAAPRASSRRALVAPVIHTVPLSAARRERRRRPPPPPPPPPSEPSAARRRRGGGGAEALKLEHALRRDRPRVHEAHQPVGVERLRGAVHERADAECVVVVLARVLVVVRVVGAGRIGARRGGGRCCAVGNVCVLVIVRGVRVVVRVVGAGGLGARGRGGQQHAQRRDAERRVEHGRLGAERGARRARGRGLRAAARSALFTSTTSAASHWLTSSRPRRAPRTGRRARPRRASRRASPTSSSPRRTFARRRA